MDGARRKNKGRRAGGGRERMGPLGLGAPCRKVQGRGDVGTYPSCFGPSSAHAPASAMSSTTHRCDLCGSVVPYWRGWKWVQQGSWFVWPMKTAGKTWWYKCCWNCWHEVRLTTLSPKLKGTSTWGRLGSTTWAGSSFFLILVSSQRKFKP